MKKNRKISMVVCGSVLLVMGIAVLIASFRGLTNPMAESEPRSGFIVGLVAVAAGTFCMELSANSQE